MPRRASASTPSTALGVAISERRGTRTQSETAAEAGLIQGTLSAMERGKRPNIKTARKLARWLGMTIEEVMVAAEQKVTPEP